MAFSGFTHFFRSDSIFNALLRSSERWDDALLPNKNFHETYSFSIPYSTTPRHNIGSSALTHDDYNITTASMNTIYVDFRTRTRRDPTSKARKGFSSLASLWNSSLEPVSPTLEMYHIIDMMETSTIRARIYKHLTNASSRAVLLKITQNLDVRPDDNSEVEIFVTFNIQANISSTVFPRESHPSYKWCEEYYSLFRGSERVFCSAFQSLDTTKDIVVLKQLGLLRCYYVNLILTATFFAEMEAEYDQRKAKSQHRLDPLRPVWDREILHELAADALLYNDFRNKAGEISETVDGLLNVLAARFPEPPPTEFRHFSAELRSMCTSTSLLAERHSTRLDTYVKFAETHHAMRESTSVWILSILAAIFLPLSLATSILSMGTRFVKLGPLLYDFVGVVIILATMVIAFVGVMVGGMLLHHNWKKYLRPFIISTRLGNAAQKMIKLTLMLSTGLNIILFWMVLLTSFLVGMIKDINLGWKILGYGTAGLVGIYLVLGLVILNREALKKLLHNTHSKSEQPASAAQANEEAPNTSVETKV